MSSKTECEKLNYQGARKEELDQIREDLELYPLFFFNKPCIY